MSDAIPESTVEAMAATKYKLAAFYQMVVAECSEREARLEVPFRLEIRSDVDWMHLKGGWSVKPGSNARQCGLQRRRPVSASNTPEGNLSSYGSVELEWVLRTSGLSKS